MRIYPLPALCRSCSFSSAEWTGRGGQSSWWRTINNPAAKTDTKLTQDWGAAKNLENSNESLDKTQKHKAGRSIKGRGWQFVKTTKNDLFEIGYNLNGIIVKYAVLPGRRSLRFPTSPSTTTSSTSPTTCWCLSINQVYFRIITYNTYRLLLNHNG